MNDVEVSSIVAVVGAVCGFLMAPVWLLGAICGPLSMAGALFCTGLVLDNTEQTYRRVGVETGHESKHGCATR